MAFWTEIWTAAMQVKDSFLGVLQTIGEVLIDAIYSIGRKIFEIVKHLYQWIDEFTTRGKLKSGDETTMVPPKDTEVFIKSLRDRGRTTLPPYTPGTKRSLIVGSDANGKVKVAQISSTEDGFEQKIQDSFDKGKLVVTPIS
jgi:hypothetical protein